MAEGPRRTIQTRNVNPGVGGARIDVDRYAMKKALLRAVPRSKDGIEFRALPAEVKRHLPGGRLPGGGSIAWHLTVVKLDLEARGALRRIEGSRPQRLRREGR